MRKIFIITIILLFSILQSNACLNFYYSIDNKGHLHSTDGLKKPFNINFNPKLIEKKLRKLEKLLIKENDYKLLSDYSVLLLKVGKIKEAVNILKQLAKHYPNEYKIAANLGTAYELNGEVENAIQFIKKGFELNPDSHNGSEWVHIKILEAKLKIARDSLYLSEKTVLNLTDNQKRDSLIRNQILIQVRERFPFSPGENPIMASLLVELGDCYANTTSIEFAKVHYTIAKLYFGANVKLVDAKVNEMVKLRKQFSRIKPEKRHIGDNFRVGGILYKSMLSDNNTFNFKVNWKRVVIDEDKLLSYVTLAEIDESSNELEYQKNELDSIVVNDSVKEENKVKLGASNYLNYFLLGSVFVLLITFLVYKKQKSKNG